MGARRLLSLARALPALLLWAAGCEALVNGQLGDVRCEVEGRVGPPGCPSASECHAGLCVPSPLGAPCAGDADCSLGDFCLDPAVFGAVGPDGGAADAPRCSRPAAPRATATPRGSRCAGVPPAGGARVCWPAAAVGRAAPGAAPAWESCAADGDCRSGRCTGGRCADTCCSDTSCLAGDGRLPLQRRAGRRGHRFLVRRPRDRHGAALRPLHVERRVRLGPLHPARARRHPLLLALLHLGRLRVARASAAGQAVGTPVLCVTLPGGGACAPALALGSGAAPWGRPASQTPTAAAAPASATWGTSVAVTRAARTRAAGIRGSLVCRPVDLTPRGPCGASPSNGP